MTDCQSGREANAAGLDEIAVEYVIGDGVLVMFDWNPVRLGDPSCIGRNRQLIDINGRAERNAVRRIDQTVLQGKVIGDVLDALLTIPWFSGFWPYSRSVAWKVRPLIVTFGAVM